MSWADPRELGHCSLVEPGGATRGGTPTTSSTLRNNFAGQFNVLPVTETWSCALAAPANRVTLPDCTEITHFSLLAIPEVVAKVRREQKWCFVIQHSDSYQLINLGRAVMTTHGTVRSPPGIPLGKKSRTTHRTKTTVFSMWQTSRACFNCFYFSIFHISR